VGHRLQRTDTLVSGDLRIHIQRHRIVAHPEQLVPYRSTLERTVVPYDCRPRVRLRTVPPR
jgi:hypothetical protein